MRHRAPRRLSLLLTRPGSRLVAALASVLLLLSGTLVVAAELGDDSIPASEGVADDAHRDVARPSRSDGRTPWPTLDDRRTGPDEQASAPAPRRTWDGAPHTSAPRPEGTGATEPAESDDRTPRPSRTRLDLPETPSAEVTPELRTATRSPEVGPSRLTEPVRPSTTGSASPTRTPTDGRAPQTTLSSTPPRRDAEDGSDEAEFSFRATEDSSFACSLDGGSYRPCDSPTEYDDLDTGWHSFAVRATDTDGNADPTPARWTWHTTGRDD